MEIRLDNNIIIIDDEFYETYNTYIWRVNKSGYVITSIGNLQLGLHHVVLGYKPIPGYAIDHINRNPLDNRRHNLRLATHAQNNMNKLPRRCKTLDGERSPVKPCIYLAKALGYAVKINRDCKPLRVQYFKTIEEAEIAHASMINYYSGEFGVINEKFKDIKPESEDYWNSYCNSTNYIANHMAASAHFATKSKFKNEKNFGKSLVYKIKSGKYAARISINNRLYNLGTYEHEVDAKIAHDSANKYYRGEHANLLIDTNLSFPKSLAQISEECRLVYGKYYGVNQVYEKHWVAKVAYNKTKIHLGTFSTAEEAAMCYDAACLYIRKGNRFRINFPDMYTIAAPPDVVKKEIRRHVVYKKRKRRVLE